jgi:hypothetical protein
MLLTVFLRIKEVHRKSQGFRLLYCQALGTQRLLLKGRTITSRGAHKTAPPEEYVKDLSC